VDARVNFKTALFDDDVEGNPTDKPAVVSVSVA
jgi:hypothetical protein